jgi:tetratricopeptide (TPR) repeat protein
MKTRWISRRLRFYLERFFSYVYAIVTWPLVVVSGIVRWLFEAVVSYWMSRRLRPFLWGAPALVLVFLCVMILIQLSLLRVPDLQRIYLSAAERAMRSENWTSAKLYFERALELGAREPDNLFDLVLVSERLGDESRKRAILERLAPDDRAVFAPAHLWKAGQILGKGEVRKEDAANAEKQLRLVLTLEPENITAHSILGDLYFQLGLMPAAIEHLQMSDRSSTQYRLLLSKAYAQNNENGKAVAIANELREPAEKQSRGAPRNVEARLDWAEATLLAGEEAKAVEILNEGSRLAEDPRYREARTMCLIQWSDRLLKESLDNKSAAFQLIAAGFENTPNEILLFDRALKLLKGTDSVVADVQEFLSENIATGRAVALSHLILGTYLLESSDRDTAGIHLRQAFKLLPTGPVIANNLAWYLVQTEPADPVQALSIMDAVIKEAPPNAEFIDTRAHILMKLNRWNDAISDLEFSLQTLGDRKLTHIALAEAYDHIGLADLAKRHRELGDQVKPEKLDESP